MPAETEPETETEAEGEDGGAFPALADIGVNPLVLTGLDQPLWLQNSTYPAAIDRQLIAAALVPGVLGTTELAVTQRAAGANYSVDVAAGRVVVPITDAPNLGSALCRSTAVNNVTIAGAPGAGTSRIDRVIARVYDASLIGGSINGWQIEVVTGTAAASPAVPALPTSSVELARVTVAAGQASVQTAHISDRRNIYPPAGATIEGFWYGPLGGSISALDVTVASFVMPFTGNIILQGEAMFLPGAAAGNTVAVASVSTVAVPAPTYRPIVYGPLQPVNATRVLLSPLGYWAGVPAGTAVTLKINVSSSAGAGAELVIDHTAGTYRLIPT